MIAGLRNEVAESVFYVTCLRLWSLVYSRFLIVSMGVGVGVGLSSIL
jgi:hypothetical protein